MTSTKISKHTHYNHLTREKNKNKRDRKKKITFSKTHLLHSFCIIMVFSACAESHQCLDVLIKLTFAQLFYYYDIVSLCFHHGECVTYSILSGILGLFCVCRATCSLHFALWLRLISFVFFLPCGVRCQRVKHKRQNNTKT